MFDGILHQRLQQHAGDDHIERRRIEFLHHPQLVAPEAHDFNVQIVVDELELLAQRRKGLARIQEAAQNRSQFEDHLARLVRIEAHQRRNRIQRVEQKMRIDLVLQCLHARVEQQPFLFFQLDLYTNAVENLQLDTDRNHRCSVDRCLHPEIVQAFDAENQTRKVSRQLRLHEAQPHDRGKKHDLPVEQPGPG